MLSSIVTLVHRCKDWLLSFRPSQVEEVVHIDDLGHSTPIYKALCPICPWWHWRKDDHLFLPNDGNYAIRVWNRDLARTKCYIWSTSMLCKALGVRTIGTWWAMSDIGVVVMLESYMRSLHGNRQRAVSILMNEVDILPTVRPYLLSIGVSKNITARTLCSLYSYLTRACVKKCDTDTVTVLDYDLKETVRCGDEYLFE